LYLAMIFTMDRSFESRLLQLLVTILVVAFDLAGGLYAPAVFWGIFGFVQLGVLISRRINPRT